MQLKNIKGNTNWIRGGTNTGVYIFEDRTVLLIDTGIGGKRQGKIIDILEEQKLKVRYIINTHEHEDHSGGNYQIKEYFKDVKVYSSHKAKIYIENPDIYMDFITGGRRTQKLVDEMGKYIFKEAKVDYIIEPGDELEIKGHIFKIIDCSGHTEGSIGVVTDDGILFLGDLMISRNSLDKFDFLFMCDYESQIRSLDNLRNIDFEYSVLGHSSGIFTKRETLEIANYNYDTLMRLIEFVLNQLEEPRDFDEIIKAFLDHKKLRCNYIAYLEYRNSLNATIAYLLDAGVIKYILDDNILKYVLSDETLIESGSMFCKI